MHDTQVPAKFNQFKSLNCQPSSIRITLIRLKWQMIDFQIKSYPSFCNFGKRFHFYRLCEIVYGYKQEFQLPWSLRERIMSIPIKRRATAWWSGLMVQPVIIARSSIASTGCTFDHILVILLHGGPVVPLSQNFLRQGPAPYVASTFPSWTSHRAYFTSEGHRHFNTGKKNDLLYILSS